MLKSNKLQIVIGTLTVIAFSSWTFLGMNDTYEIIAIILGVGIGGTGLLRGINGLKSENNKN